MFDFCSIQIKIISIRLLFVYDLSMLLVNMSIMIFKDTRLNCLEKMKVWVSVFFSMNFLSLVVLIKDFEERVTIHPDFNFFFFFLYDFDFYWLVVKCSMCCYKFVKVCYLHKYEFICMTI